MFTAARLIIAQIGNYANGTSAEMVSTLPNNPMAEHYTAKKTNQL